MERKETITLLELSKRVGDHIAADTLAETYLSEMDWQNLPSNEIFDKIDKYLGPAAGYYGYFVDDDQNVYYGWFSDETVEGEVAFENVETGEIVAADDLANYAHEFEDLDELRNEYINYERDFIYEWYLIDESAAEYLKKYSEEIVTYVEKIDCYFWGVTSFGTPWQGVEVDMTYDY